MTETSIQSEVAQITGEARSESAQLAYRYRGQDLAVVWHTSVPRDDEAALAYFHVISRFGKDFKPVYCERITRDENGDNETVTMLQEIFDPVNCETRPFEL